MPDGWLLRPLASEVVGLDAGVSVNAEDRPHALGEIGVLKTSALGGGTFQPSENKTVLSTERARVRVSVRAESVLVSRMNTPELVGEAAFVPRDYPDLYLPDRIWQVRMRDSEACAVRWLGHYLRSPLARSHIAQSASGTSGSMKNLPKERFLAMQVNWPPLPEQRQIAAILDTIDDAIRKTEQIIAKLKQVKQGLLHDLLTCGIDDNGELRDPERHPEQFEDSPLGRIPRPWEIAELSQTLSRIEAGNSPSCPDRPAQGDEWGVLKVSAVRPTGFRANENKVIVNSAHVDPSIEVKHGDLLITRANTYELVGLTCLVENPPPRLLLCDKTLRLVVDKDRADSRFIYFTTQMPYVRAQIEIHATGSSGSMKNIGQRAIRSIQTRLAPRVEQTEIADRLDMLDQRQATEARSLEAARMLKAGLMDDLLTGRVRVTKLLENATP